MSAVAKPKMTAEEFVVWAEAQQGRYELVDGEVFAQASERVAHAKTKGAAYVALLDAVRRAGAPCHVLPDGMAVRIDDKTVFEPDAQLYCGPELPPDTLLVPAPIIVVEVVSPSTKAMISSESSSAISVFRVSRIISSSIPTSSSSCITSAGRGAIF